MGLEYTYVHVYHTNLTHESEGYPHHPTSFAMGTKIEIWAESSSSKQ